MNESNQSIIHSINQSANQSVNQLINQSIKSINQSMNQIIIIVYHIIINHTTPYHIVSPHFMSSQASSYHVIPCQITKGSLEIKFPTIWADGKARTGSSSGREKVRRERIRDGEDQRGRISEDRRCRCAKR